ncbi:hypothetical protein [Halorubrum halodurans]|uniref:Uncharacterized protein n=1 Tax=Halorubrum halodurans TaxID=1383851 RepID=A0A256IK05_9EURY|nr:hypothetical protein [Halorubrum halodurans]OYR56646.1 hypothetical protein DJ70_07990 [Halorubrum halodurans]
MSEDTHTIYRCSECGVTAREVSSLGLDRHIVWEHVPGGNPYTDFTDNEQAYIDATKQRVEIPDVVLLEYVVEDGEER